MQIFTLENQFHFKISFNRKFALDNVHYTKKRTKKARKNKSKNTFQLIKKKQKQKL